MRLVISGGYRDAKRLGALKYDALSFFSYGGVSKKRQYLPRKAAQQVSASCCVQQRTCVGSAKPPPKSAPPPLKDCPVYAFEASL